MKRVDKLQREFKETDDNKFHVNSTNSAENGNDNNSSTECESKNENSLLQCQIAEEKAAAKIFPLNLISNRFKPKDPNALKGKFLYVCAALI